MNHSLIFSKDFISLREKGRDGGRESIGGEEDSLLGREVVRGLD